MRFLISLELQAPVLLSNDIFADTESLREQTQISGKQTFSSLHAQYSSLTLESIDMAPYKALHVTAQSELCELGMGRIHLYRADSDLPASISDVKPAATSSMVAAVLAVPSYMTSADFVGYLGEAVQKEMSHLRMIRTEEANRYMVLIKFRRPEHAVHFVKHFNGRPFNSVDPETAHCVLVSDIILKGQSSTAEDFPSLLDQDHGNVQRSSTTKKPLAPMTASLTELPTCVVCLERMDSAVTGLLTILCEHTFHCDCISKWVDKQSTCPVCRFSIAKDMMQNPAKVCSACPSDKSLWMCLICGNCACGRYESQHAIAHFNRSRHSFAMDLDSGRIWDYSSDSYVHRLVQDKLDAKPDKAKLSSWDTTDGSAQGEEFEELLMTQLESQRMFYEGQLQATADKIARNARMLQDRDEESTTLRSEASFAQQEHQRLLSELEDQRSQHKQSTRKIKVLTDLSKKWELQYKDEKEMSAALMGRVKHLETERDSALKSQQDLENELAEMKEQLHDLMLHLSTENQLQALSPDDRQEIQQGNISVSTRTNKSKGRIT